MQIDFHHGATYVIARLAGLEPEKAEIVAYCSQYVDDATNGGSIIFENGAHYSRISSAHKMLDYRNAESLANSRVWLPFHFLPGNGGKPAGENPEGKFINKIICRPNSYVAQDLVRNCIEEKNTRYGLYRLGITMHVYADTWAHQGFAGVNNKINAITELDDNDKGKDGIFGKFKNYFGDIWEDAQGTLIGDAFPLGHGSALSYPDRPWLKWSYLDSSEKRVERDNTAIFMEASDHLCMSIRRYIKGDPDAPAEGLPSEDRKKIEEMFLSIKDGSGETRHEKWLEKIKEGYFSFGPVDLKYIPKGHGSWKHQALESDKEFDDEDDTFPYRNDFLDSHWKMFHDSLQAHRFIVLHDILPKYGICAD